MTRRTWTRAALSAEARRVYAANVADGAVPAAAYSAAAHHVGSLLSEDGIHDSVQADIIADLAAYDVRRRTERKHS